MAQQTWARVLFLRGALAVQDALVFTARKLSAPALVLAIAIVVDGLTHRHVVTRTWYGRHGRRSQGDNPDKRRRKRNGRHLAVVFSLTLKTIAFVAAYAAVAIAWSAYASRGGSDGASRSRKEDDVTVVLPVVAGTSVVLVGAWMSAAAHDAFEAAMERRTAPPPRGSGQTNKHKKDATDDQRDGDGDDGDEDETRNSHEGATRAAYRYGLLHFALGAALLLLVSYAR